eukprot:scaffold129523_cov69-Phaeocystis_antarctica.AAC.1
MLLPPRSLRPQAGSARSPAWQGSRPRRRRGARPWPRPDPTRLRPSTQRVRAPGPPSLTRCLAAAARADFLRGRSARPKTARRLPHRVRASSPSRAAASDGARGGRRTSGKVGDVRNTGRHYS